VKKASILNECCCI